MNVTTEIVGYMVGKVAGSRGQFGRLDNWGVLRLEKTLFDGVANGFPPQRIIVSHHNSKAAAEKAMARLSN